MILFFRKLPLTVKLSIIGIIPILFLCYFAILIHKEKSSKVELIGKYIEQVQQSKNVGELTSQLGIERRVSYQYTLGLQSHQDVLLQRSKTDSVINILENSNDLALYNFSEYTFLDKLADTRKEIDTVISNRTYPIIQFYTNAIYRINTLNATLPPTNLFLGPVYQDMIAQKILSELITYLGAIRAKVYDVLYTKEQMNEPLSGTLGIYKVFNTYEKEFLIKASPASVQLYQQNKKSSDYHLTLAYLDKLFTISNFDSIYTPAQWWDISSGGIFILKRQQENLWKNVDNRMKAIYQHEKNVKNATLVFLLVAILFVFIFVLYFINHITKLLQEIKIAARKISKGETGLNLNNMPDGIIGSLAKSIIQIDKNNLMLANAANEIGKGNFNVMVKPRSNEDLLGISIKKMKMDLSSFTSQKDKIQKDTAELVHRRDEFFSIASHELRTPITSLKAYTQLMQMDAESMADSEHAQMLAKMDIQIDKLTSLIAVLLDTSKVQEGKLDYNKKPFKIRELIDKIIEKIRPTTLNQQLIFIADSNATIVGDRDRIGQVVSNLLTNATKYATTSKKIIVALKQSSGKVVCSVQDFGNGIAEAEHNKIFERFYRVLGNNLHTYPGLGLGLYISRGIVENHCGKIWVESEVGKGSTFYFELPIAR